METYPEMSPAAPTAAAKPAQPASRQRRRGHGGATLRDVALAAGVTAITVSRFLREPERVAEPTAQRIRAALAQTGYVPHKQAGMLASGHGKVVAVLLPNLANSIFAETAQGLADALQPAGYELLMTSTGYSLEREEEQLRAVLGWRPAAVIVTGRRHSAVTLAMLQGAQRDGTPVVEIWDCPAESGSAAGPALPASARAVSPFAQVGLNHEAIGRAMAQALMHTGHRHLAYVDSGVAEDYRAHERGLAFAEEARAHGARVLALTAAAGDLFEAGRLSLTALLAPGADGTSAPVTAAAFANDHLAAGALLEAAQRDVQVPHRLALLGFGDFAWSRHLRPALSSVWVPREAIGSRAAASVLRALRGGSPAERHEALAWDIRWRASTDTATDTAADAAPE